MVKTGILLVNLGTPDSPSTGDVRRYLLQFLTDGRVIDIPWLPRQLLVRGIIAPFRAPKSAATYREIWTPEGSPLMVYGQRLLERLRAVLEPEYPLELAMRYQNPSIEKGLLALRARGVERVVVFPLFPQYASATTGSVHEEVMRVLSTWQGIPELQLVGDYFDHPAFIRAFAEAGQAMELPRYDHVLFSYHGLPERHIRKADDQGVCRFGSCCDAIGASNRLCYRAQCMATTRALVRELGLEEGGYTTCFQSRLGRDPWIQPYTSDVLKQLAERGVRRLLVFCPAFVADCIETIDEIAVEYAEEFREAGGEELTLVESLNDRESWVSALCTILSEKAGIAVPEPAS
jgi:ferrochelatase